MVDDFIGLKYNELYSKKSNGTISTPEEEELLSLFKILRSYGEVDDISSQILTTKLNASIDAILGKLDELLKK